MYFWWAAAASILWICCRCLMTVNPWENFFEQSGQTNRWWLECSCRKWRISECLTLYLKQRKRSRLVGRQITVQLVELLSAAFLVGAIVVSLAEMLVDFRLIPFCIHWALLGRHIFLFLASQVQLTSNLYFRSLLGACKKDKRHENVNIGKSVIFI